jgi:hypothetical protein
MIQEVIYQPVTMKTWVKFQASACRNIWQKKWHWDRLSSKVSVFPCQHLSPSAPLQQRYTILATSTAIKQDTLEHGMQEALTQAQIHNHGLSWVDTNTDYSTNSTSDTNWATHQQQTDVSSAAVTQLHVNISKPVYYTHGSMQHKYSNSFGEE